MPREDTQFKPGKEVVGSPHGQPPLSVKVSKEVFDIVNAMEGRAKADWLRRVIREALEREGKLPPLAR